MIVPESFRRTYDSKMPVIKELQNRAANLLKDTAQAFEGHYIDRIKTVESVLSKAEAGTPIDKQNDLFAATISVPSLDKVREVSMAITHSFEIVDTKSHRKKNPREFVYDDLHLVLKLKDSPLVRDKDVLHVCFELQIKTLLQLAWWQLEHDLVYKTKRLSWQVARVFGQIKAMFELADRMLINVESAANLQEEEEYQPYVETNQVSEILESIWGTTNPPWYDLRRTSETVRKLVEFADVSIDDLRGTLRDNADLITARSITAAQATFIALYRLKQKEIQEHAHDNYFLITDEMLDIEPKLRAFIDLI